MLQALNQRDIPQAPQRLIRMEPVQSQRQKPFSVFELDFAPENS
jgi:uncharacterized lipoprotein YbaY